MSYELEKPKKSFIPYEYDDQRTVFIWAALQIQEKRSIELCFLFDVSTPNAARRSFALMQSMETPYLPIAPDICVPVPRGGYGALYIELKHESAKRRKEGADEDFLEALRTAGNVALTVYGPGKR